MSNLITLGQRMKIYEEGTGTTLLPRMPTIIRVDGKAFHTFTKRINKQNDPTSEYGPSEKMHDVMMATTQALCLNIQNAVFAYTQSDEISILMVDYNNINTERWFGGTVQKIVSVSASIAATNFNYFWTKEFGEFFENRELAQFDSRVFQLPKEEVCNYFIWRQQDATHNSVNFFARKYFSHKQLQGKNNSEVQEMLWQQHGINWNDYDTWKKRGSCIFKRDGNWVVDENIPIFTQDRYYVQRLVEAEER